MIKLSSLVPSNIPVITIIYSNGKRVSFIGLLPLVLDWIVDQGHMFEVIDFNFFDGDKTKIIDAGNEVFLNDPEKVFTIVPVDDTTPPPGGPPPVSNPGPNDPPDPTGPPISLPSNIFEIKFTALEYKETPRGKSLFAQIQATKIKDIEINEVSFFLTIQNAFGDQVAEQNDLQVGGATRFATSFDIDDIPNATVDITVKSFLWTGHVPISQTISQDLKINQAPGPGPGPGPAPGGSKQTSSALKMAGVLLASAGGLSIYKDAAKRIRHGKKEKKKRKKS